MHAGGALEERVVPRHREVDSGTGECPRIDPCGETHDCDDRHDVASAGPQQPFSDNIQYAPLHTRELRYPDDIEIEHVEEEIDDSYRRRSQEQRARYIAPGITNLFRHV